MFGGAPVAFCSQSNVHQGRLGRVLQHAMREGKYVEAAQLQGQTVWP